MSPRIIVTIFSLLFAPLAHCAMTVGWKMPVDSVIGGLPGNEGAHKLDKPPGSSAFFQPGDELWDISEAVMERAEAMESADDQEDDPGPFSPPPSVERPKESSKRKWPGEWLVWNARSGVIIARGSREDILFAQSAIEVLEQPTVIRTKLELVRGVAGKTDSVSLVARSGGWTAMNFSPWDIGMEPTLGAHGDVIDERVDLSWTEGTMKWNLSTSTTCHVGQRTRIASQGSGEQRWELFLTPRREYSSGVPISEVRWKESPEGVVCWPIPSEDDRHEPGKTPEGLQIAVYNVPPDFVHGPGEEKEETRPKVQVPAALAEVMSGEVEDFGDKLRSKGFAMLPGSFAGFDPKTDRVIFAASQADQDLLQALVKSFRPRWVPPLWVETDLASGGWGIVCRSGEKATLTGKSGEKELIFEIEGTTSTSNDAVIDVRYCIDLLEKLEGEGRLNAAATLHSGTPQVIAARAVPGQDEHKVTLTAGPNLPVPETQAAKPAPGH